jgi:hypothetical protein
VQELVERRLLAVEDVPERKKPARKSSAASSDTKPTAAGSA